MSLQKNMKEIFLGRAVPSAGRSGEENSEVGAGPQDDLVLY